MGSMSRWRIAVKVMRKTVVSGRSSSRRSHGSSRLSVGGAGTAHVVAVGSHRLKRADNRPRLDVLLAIAIHLFGHHESLTVGAQPRHAV